MRNVVRDVLDEKSLDSDGLASREEVVDVGSDVRYFSKACRMLWLTREGHHKATT